MRLSGFRLPVERLSATSLADFIACPERWRRERLLGEWGKQSLDAFIGRVHHRALGMSLRYRSEGIEVADDDRERIYHYAWYDEYEAVENEPEWTEKPDEVRARGIKMLASTERMLTEIDPVSIECWFEERIPGIPVPIVGSIDTVALEGNWEFKTAKQKVSTPKPKWRLQGRIYQLASRKPLYWGVTTKQVTPVSYWPANEPNLTIPIADPDQTVTLIQQVVHTINDLYLRYGPDRPWPTLGLGHDWQCSYCTFGPKNPNPTCPAWLP